MGTLSSLPGVAAREVEAPTVRTRNGFMDALKTHRAAISAGGRGSCLVWIDDAGSYRCEFSQFMCTKDSQTFTKLAEVRQWLRDWMPKQN